MKAVGVSIYTEDLVNHLSLASLGVTSYIQKGTLVQMTCGVQQ